MSECDCHEKCVLDAYRQNADEYRELAERYAAQVGWLEGERDALKAELAKARGYIRNSPYWDLSSPNDLESDEDIAESVQEALEAYARWESEGCKPEEEPVWDGTFTLAVLRDLRKCRRERDALKEKVEHWKRQAQEATDRYNDRCEMMERARAERDALKDEVKRLNLGCDEMMRQRDLAHATIRHLREEADNLAIEQADLEDMHAFEADDE